MGDLLVEVESMRRSSRVRPSMAQMKAVLEFVRKHPDLAHRKLRYGVSQQKFQKLWIELADIANSIDGTMKSTRGWIKFWSDKRRGVLIKQKQIDEGKTLKLSHLEQKILELCGTKPNKKKRRSVKQELQNGHEKDKIDDFLSNDDVHNFNSTGREEQQLDLMDKLVDAMSQQADALAQVAQAHLDNAKSLGRLAEASHIQALAVDRLASSVESIGSSVHEVRNTLLGIDFTMKSYTVSAGQQRQSSHLFS